MRPMTVAGYLGLLDTVGVFPGGSCIRPHTRQVGYFRHLCLLSPCDLVSQLEMAHGLLRMVCGDVWMPPGGMVYCLVKMRLCFRYVGVWLFAAGLFSVFEGLLSMPRYSVGRAPLPFVNGGLGMRDGIRDVFLMRGRGNSHSKQA